MFHKNLSDMPSLVKVSSVNLALGIFSSTISAGCQFHLHLLWRLILLSLVLYADTNYTKENWLYLLPYDNPFLQSSTLLFMLTSLNYTGIISLRAYCNVCIWCRSSIDNIIYEHSSCLNKQNCCLCVR